GHVYEKNVNYEIESDTNDETESYTNNNTESDYEKDSNDETESDYEKDTNNGSDNELERDTNIRSYGDNRTSENINSCHLPLTRIELYCGKIFETWEECQETLERYARQNNFTAPLEKQRNKGSKRINCPFLVNTSKSKNSNEMKELIESYTLCDLDVPSQVQLLRGLFPEATIVDYDSGDAAKLLQHLEEERMKDPDWYIQSLIDPDTNRLQGVFYMKPKQRKLWRRYADIVLNDNTAATNTYCLPLSIFAIVDNNFKSQIVTQGILSDETSESYRWLLQQTIEATGVQPGAFIIDADLGLEGVVPEIYPDTYLLYCAFYLARNIQYKEAFERYWKQLMIDFPQSTEYLLKQLDPRKTTWAKAFTSQIFTAGITSIQRSESINSMIKRTVNERTQLHILFKRIEMHIAEEQFTSLFSVWHNKTRSYMAPSIPGRLFLNIYDSLQKYIMPKILQLHVDQMNEAVMYYSRKTNLKEI
ncbi:16647_t:CDS:2, partial [Dentiscutata erythropus]